MRRQILILLCFFAAPFLLFSKEDSRVQSLEIAVNKAQDSAERAQLLKDLAIAYDEADEEEEGVRVFIQALKELPGKSRSMLTQEELVFTREAEQLYLDIAHNKPEDIAEETLARYGPVVDEYPQFHYLNYYLAVAYANKGDFKQFYERFFQSYQLYPKEHIAYRSLAILHLRLWERATDPVERESERKEVVTYLEKAIDKNSADASLYKFLIILAEKSQGHAAFKKFLPALLQQKAVIPRSDLQFYFAEAFTYKEYELAQQLINQASGWYDYSQTLVEAQLALDRINKELE